MTRGEVKVLGAAMAEVVRWRIHRIWYNVIWIGNAYTVDLRCSSR